MKIKKFLIVAIMAILSFSLMACPSVVDMPPKIVILEDGEITEITEMVYYHTQQTPFDPEVMLQSLIDDQGLAGIDYNQNGIAMGNTRRFDNITENLYIETFYDVYTDQDDVDEDLIGEFKTDEEGNYMYHSGIIALISYVFTEGDDDFRFIIRLVDEEGSLTELPARIVFKAPE